VSGPLISPIPIARAPLKPSSAHALLVGGNTSAALDLVLEVLEADPLCVEARLIAGIAYQLSGDAQQASAALRAALVLAPDLWPAEMYLGFALRQLGEEASARRALRRGAQLASSAERLPLSASVATWFETWRVEAIELGGVPLGRGGDDRSG
jgi:Flp pilus assembly protein TadD